MVFYKAELKKSDLNSNYFIHGHDFVTPVLEVDLECEKGAYIRSWVHHLGQRLGCGALMSGLVRHSSGSFNLENAISYSQLLDIDQIRLDLRTLSGFKKRDAELDEITTDVQEKLKVLTAKLETKLSSLQGEVIDLKKCFSGVFLRVFPNEIRLLKNGQIPHELGLKLRPYVKQCQFENKTQLVRIFNSDLSQLIAVLELPSQGKPKIVRAFQDL